LLICLLWKLNYSCEVFEWQTLLQDVLLAQQEVGRCDRNHRQGGDPQRERYEQGATTKHQAAHQERPHEAQSSLTRQEPKTMSMAKSLTTKGRLCRIPFSAPEEVNV
jgi:hypothetical protein